MATISVFSVLFFASLAMGRPSSTHVPTTPSQETVQDIHDLVQDVATASRNLFLTYCENHEDVEIFLNGRSCAQYLPSDAASHNSLPSDLNIEQRFVELYRRVGNYTCTLEAALCLYDTVECSVNVQEECDTTTASVLPQDDSYCAEMDYDYVYSKLDNLLINMRALPELEESPRGECPPMDWGATQDRVHDILISMYGASRLGHLMNITLQEGYPHSLEI